MITTIEQKSRLEKLAEEIDIPRSYYEKAVARYKSISEWLCRPESIVAKFNPKVYVQGSFRLGLVNRPLGDHEEYDLDLVVESTDLSKTVVTQVQLKEMLGAELKAYAQSMQIKSPVIERKRCWRIDYADEVNFHIDNLPSIPEDEAVIQELVRRGVPIALAKTSIALTCKEHETYRFINPNWPMSNPNGYGLWFEQRFGSIASVRRMRLVEKGLYKAAADVPTYELKTPLQSAIQVLKRHRDSMFQTRPELKPISIIITTLAARAYEGEDNLLDTLSGVLDRMAGFIRAGKPRIANPVNPGEDFADKWANKPELEQNFWLWHTQARLDLEALKNAQQSDVRKLYESRFGNRRPTETRNPATARAVATAAPALVVGRGPKPWGHA
jgi:hypothetical protein